MRDVGAEAGGDLGRVRADHAAAEDRDVGRRDARHAAQQNAAAHLRPLQILRPFLNAHPAGDFAHRRQQRQPALVVARAFRRPRPSRPMASMASVSLRSAAK